MENLSGIYAVLVVGSCLAFILSFVYWCLFVYRKAKFYEVWLNLISFYKIYKNSSLTLKSIKIPNYVLNIPQVPFCDALTEEFKIVISFAENERALKSAQSVYSHSRNSSQSIDSLETDSENNVPEDD